MASAVEKNPTNTENAKILSPNTVSEQIYDFIFNPDIANKFLIVHYEVLLSIVLFYILFVKWIGPYVMRNRKPFDLKTVMIIFNFLNVASNLYICWIMFTAMWENWPKRCGVRKYQHSSEILKKILPVGWIWMLNKIFDLLDTVFFILRKKFNQVTYLHVVHHAGLVLLGLVIIKYNAYTFYMCIGLCINCFIHAVMYTYYTLAAFGPHMQKYLWWKRYMTQMQIIQFVVILVYMIHAFATDCEMMGSFELAIFFFVVFNLVMFLNFYRKSYKAHKS